MAASPRRTVEIDSELLERARRVARKRGVAVPQLVREALEHEMGDEPLMAPLPQGWGETLTGEPMPDVVVAVRRSREEH
jgi:hypothetical protein